MCEQLLKRVPEGRVIGIDASANMVDAARDFLAPLYGDRISIQQADLQVFCAPEMNQSWRFDIAFITARARMPDFM